MKYALIAILTAFCFASCQTSGVKDPDKEAAKKENVEPVVEEFVEHYDNGQIKIEGRLVNDERQGVWTSYYLDGTKWSETTFENGIKSGPTTTYYEDGIMRYKGRFEDDLKTGTWTFYDEEGKVEKTLDMTTEVPETPETENQN